MIDDPTNDVSVRRSVYVIALLAELGCMNVRTYIQSGNVVLSNEREISVGYLLPGTGPLGASHKRYPTLISRPILGVIEGCPYRCVDGKQLVDKQLHVFFLESAPESPDFKTLDEIKTSTEKFYLVGKVFYL